MNAQQKRVLKAAGKHFFKQELPEDFQESGKIVQQFAKGIVPQKITPEVLNEIVLMPLVLNLVKSKGFQRIRNAQQADQAIKDIEAADALKFQREVQDAQKRNKKMLRNLFPPIGGPGRKPKLTIEQKRGICSVISTFEASGNTKRDAMNLAVNQFKVSFRTVRRVWENRPY